MSATTIDELQVLISANAAAFQREMKNVRAELGQIGRSAKESTGSVAGGFIKAQLALGGLKAAFGMISSVAQKGIKEFGSLEQNLGGAEAVFGQFSDTVKQAAKDSAKTMGTSMSQYLGSANKMGSLFQGAGLSVSDSMKMTTTSMQRAADVASVMGISQEMALESIAGMAKGNFTMMDNLGVAMNDTALSAWMLERGIAGNVNQMAIGEKVGIAYQMFMDRTSKYAGNFARESMTLEGSLAIMRAELSNVAATLGMAFAPMVSSAASFVSNVLAPAINAVIPYVVALGNIINQVAASVFSFIGGIFGASKGVSGVGSSSKSASNAMKNLGASAGGAGGGMGGAAKGAKALKKELAQLAKFDEMNVLKSPEEPSGGSGGSGGGGGAPALKIPEMNFGKFNSGFDEISAKAKKIADEIKKYFEGMFDLPKISAAFGEFWEGLKVAGGEVFAVIIDIWKSYIKPFISWTGNDFLPAFLRATGAELELLGKVISVAWNSFLKPFIDAFLVPIAKFTGGMIIGWLNTLTDALKSLSGNEASVKALVATLSSLIITMTGMKVANLGIDAATLAFTKLGGVKSTLANASGALSAFNKGIIGWPTLLSSLSGGFGGFITKIGSLRTAMSGASGIFSALGGVAKGLWGVLAANPIGAVVAVLGLLFATNEKFRNGVMSLISAALKPLGEIFTNLTALIDPLVKVVIELANIALKPLFVILEAVGNALGGLLEFLSPIVGVISKLAVAFNPLNIALKIAKPILEALGFAFEKLGEFLGWVGQQIEAFFKPAFDAVGKVIGEVKAHVDQFVQGLPDWAKNLIGVSDSAKETKKSNEELKDSNKELKSSVDEVFEAENRLKNARAGLAGSLAGLIESTTQINEKFGELGMKADFSQEKLAAVGSALSNYKTPAEQAKFINDQLGLSLDATNLAHLKQIDAISQLGISQDEYNAKLQSSAVNHDALTKAMQDTNFKSESVRTSFHSLIQKFGEGGLSADQLSRKISDLAKKGDEDSISLKDAIIRNADAFGMKWDEVQKKMVSASTTAKVEISKKEEEKAQKIASEMGKAAFSAAGSFSNISSAASGAANSTTKSFDGKGAKIGGEARNAKNGFIENFAKFGQIAMDAWSQTQSPFSNVYRTFAGIGSNIWNGMKAGIGNLASAMTNMFSGAVNNVKKFLGIHSPSRLFMGLGGFVGEGFAIGINDEQKTVMNALSGLTSGFETPTLSIRTDFSNMKVADLPDVSSLNRKIQQDFEISSGLGDLGEKLDRLNEKPQQIVVKIGEEKLVDKLIDGINENSFLRNESMINL